MQKIFRYNEILMDHLKDVIIYSLLIQMLVKQSLSINSPFISNWESIQTQTYSPIFILHPLGEMPIKVDLQIRVSRNGSNYMFSGFGAGQRGEEEGDTRYGAVLYSYNESHVRLHVPVSSITNKGGLINTGFTGPFDAYYFAADVRIRAWRICDFPPANFSTNRYGVGGPPYSPGVNLNHNLGVIPDLVIVQLKMADGFVYEADGAVFKDRRLSSDRACGTVFAYDLTSIRVWGMAKRQGTVGYVGCAYKGWGTGYAASLALLVISAWILPAEDIVFTQTITVAKNSVHPNILPISPTVSTDNHLFVVKVKADDGANEGFVFHGSGTSLTDGSLSNYGGVIYAYDESEVLLWRPSDDNTNGYILYMGGDLGGGAYPQMSTQGDVTVSIIRTLTPYEGNCGVGTCVGNWSQIIVVCDCVGTGLSGQYCTKATSPPPSSLLAGVKDEEESRLLHLGSKRNLTINLEFPIETSPNIVVVIKASSSKEVMALASASVTGKGNNIQPFSTRLYYSFSSSSMISGFYFIFSGNLSLGDIVNSGSSNIYRDNMVTIISEIFVQSINDVTNGEQHKVNVMILVDGVGVWGKDISYIISTCILTPIKTPEIYPRYPSTSYLERGTMTRVTVDLWMPLANPDIVVISRSTTGGEDTKLRVFRVAVTKVGENYQLPVILERYNVVGTVCSDVTGNKTLYLTFPTHFANKDAFESTPVSSRDLVRLETVVYMDKESQLNTRYSLEFVIVVDGVILWNSTFNFISSNFVLIPVIQRMKTLPYNDLLSTGREFTSDVNLTSSQFGVYQFNVTLTSLKSGGQGAAGLLITSVTIGNTGSNVLCSAVSVYFKRSNNSRIQNVAEVTLNITNFGSPVPSATEDKDWLILKLTAIPVPVYTKLTEVHTIKINTSSVSSQFNYTIYGEVPYDQNMMYIVDIYHYKSVACISENQTFEFFINITTVKNKTPGPMFITLPVGDTVFSVQEYKIVHVGENLLRCFQTIQLDGSLDRYIIYEDGSFGNISLEFPLLCNNEVTSDTDGDILTIRVVVSLRKDAQIGASSVEYFTVEITSPGFLQTVTSSLLFTVQIPTVSLRPLIVYGIEVLKTFTDVILFPSKCRVEYSIDGINYSTTNLIYVSENASHAVYDLESRSFAVKLHLAEAERGNSTCCVLHRFLYLNIEESLQVLGGISEQLLPGLPSIFDRNNDSCMQLPVQGHTPPILWMQINTSVLWGLNPSSFVLSVLGQGINCKKHNKKSVLQVVYYPTSPTSGDFRGEVTYCIPRDSESSGQCIYLCPCAGPLCSVAYVFMASSDISYSWTVCEISAENE